MTSAHSSTFSPPISYNNQSPNLRRHRQCRSLHRGRFTHASRARPSQIFECLLLWFMSSYRSYPACRHTLIATARPGTITGDSCKAWRLTSAESTAVYSPSTWIGVTHRNNSFSSSILAPMQIGRWSDYSLPNSGPKCHVAAAAAAYKMAGTSPNLIIPNLTWRGREVVIDYEFLPGGSMRRSSTNCAWTAPRRPRRSVSRTPTRWRIMARQRMV